MDALLSFLPQDRVRALAARRPLPDRCRGAALFADISGFTALTGALAAELGRKRGAEELLVHINRAHDRLIAAVEDHAGAVVGFAGDSITCWFDDAPPGLEAGPPGAARSLAAAERMHAALQSLPPARTPGGATVRLAVKVAIAAGGARRFAVGDPARQRLDTLAGETLARMAALERTAREGETLIDPPQGSPPAAGPTPWPPPPALEVAMAAEWVLPPVVEHLEAGGAFLGELRPAVAMFIGFTGIDYDRAPDAEARLDAWVRWVQDTLAGFGGEVIQLTIGDKGSNLYAAFGAPTAHEDDVDRACAAALALQGIPPALGGITEVRIGLAQGQVFAGACGSARRRCYAVMGEPVNLAARLMVRAAPGEVLAEERVVQGARAHRFTPVRYEMVKGRAEPLGIATLAGAAGPRPARAGTPRGHLIGREAELARVLEALTGPQAGTVLLDGEAGVGKSRLLAEVVAGCRAAGRAVLQGQGNSVERNRAWLGWREIALALLGDLPAADHVGAVQRRLAALDPALVPYASLLAPVLGMAIPEAAEVREMDAAGRAERTQELLVRLLAAAGPLVVVLEDAHWLDSASWAMVQALRRAALPVGLLAVARPARDAAREGPVHEAWSALASHPDTVHVTLGPLAAADAMALARQRIGAATLPPAVARVITDRAEGNALFVEELAQAMLEAGVLRVEEGHGVLADPSGAAFEAFPDTLEGLVTSRLDRLPAPAQRTAKVASVIGRVFGLEPLRAIHPVPDELPRLAQSLEELARLDIARAEHLPGDAWAFRHAIIHEVAYGSLPFAQRQALHRAIATWYQQAAGADLDAHLPLLAHHWERADAPAEALEFGERAGVQALRNFANREAAEHLTRVVARLETGQGAEDPVRTVRVLRQLAEALYLSGDVPRAGERLRQLFARTRWPLPRSAGAAWWQLGGAMLRQLGHRRLPALLLRDPPAGRAERAEVARALALLTFTYYYTGDLLGAFLANFQSLNLAEQVRSDPHLAPDLAHAYTNVGAVFTNIFGMPRTGARYFRRAEAVASEAGATQEQGYLDQVRGMVAISTGTVSAAEAPLTRAWAQFEGLGNWRKWEEVGYSLAQLDTLRGRLAEAEATVRRVAHSSRRRESTQARMLAEAQLGCILIWQGRLEEAEGVLRDAASLHAREPYLAERTFIAGQLALIHARRGEADGVAVHLADVRRLLDEGRPNPVAVEGYAAATLAALSPGPDATRASRLDAARAALAPLRQLTTVGSRVYRARRLLLEGMLGECTGHPRLALRRWRQGLAFAAARGLRPDEALLCQALARHGRLQHAARLHELATTLPAPWLLEPASPPPPSNPER